MANGTENNSPQSGSTGQKENKQPLPLWRRIALGFVIAAMAGILGLMLMAYIAKIQFCGEIRKVGKAGEPTKFPDLLAGQAGTQTDKDANSLYVDVFAQFRPADTANFMQTNLFYRNNMASLPTEQFPSDLREKVTENLNKAKSIFDNLDKGAQLALSEFNIGVTLGSQVCKARIDSVQCAVCLSSLRTLDLILAGKGDAAADSIISTLQLTRVFDTYPTILVYGRKLTSVGLACDDIQLLLANCPPSERQLSRLQAQLEKMFSSDSFKSSLLAERIYQLEIARNLIPRSIASKYLMADAPPLPERLAVPSSTWYRMRLFFASAKYMRNMAWLIKISSQPWPAPLDELNAVMLKSPAKSSGLIPSVSSLSVLTAEILAVVRCTTSAIAIERYRLHNGRIPDGLADICPTYIKSIPLDPFTGKALFYIRDDQSYAVYSAGVNRIDDRGAVTSKAREQATLDTGIRIKRTLPK